MTGTRGENTLILAPLSPSGLDAYLNRVAASCPNDPDLVAISYTQPPREWTSAWESYVGALPERNMFIKGGSLNESEPHGFAEVISVDPADPMSIVVPVEQKLSEWESTGNDTVLSMQTLSILLQYSEIDTVFRYLNLLTHKVRAVGAQGYYQLDPELHDETTVNTMKVLFDDVVTIDEEELSERRTAQTTASGSSESPVDHLLSLYESSKSRLSDVLGPATSESTDTDESPPAEKPPAETEADDEAEPAAEDEAAGDVIESGEELLTDGERIRRLLLQSGGQMRQTALVSALPWSSSTVSRKLTEMEDQGEVSRVQVGRGKIVFHPGSEPEAAKSPLGSTQNQPQVLE